MTRFPGAADPAPVTPSITYPPAGAPNVVVVLLDDVGFGAASTFGGPVPTPALDRVAGAGLRYNQFHTTALFGKAHFTPTLLPGRSRALLDRTLRWLQDNNRPIVVVVGLGFGIWFGIKALHGFGIG